MSEKREISYRTRLIAAPIIAFLISFVLLLEAIRNTYALIAMYIIIPLEIFLVLRYLRIFRLSTRIYAGLIVLLAVVLSISGVYTHDIYQTKPVFSGVLNDTTRVTTSVTPYAGYDQSFNFSLFIVPNGTINLSKTTLNIRSPSVYNVTITFSEMHAVEYPNGSALIYYVTDNLPAGIYSYNFTFNMTTRTDYTGQIPGPYVEHYSGMFGVVLTEYFIFYFLPMAAIFVIGLFVARSIGNSQRRAAGGSNGEKPK